MPHYYDTLPVSIRRRLRDSSHNLCPACLVTKFQHVIRRNHPAYSREQVLLAAIELMERLVPEAE
jgi:hypothetical protein